MREHRPPFVDYYQNSVKATRAQQQFFANVLSKEFPEIFADDVGNVCFRQPERLCGVGRTAARTTARTVRSFRMRLPVR